mgnify:CR=1 FL=1
MATIQVREYNLERTLRAIRSSGPSTTSELTRATGLSRPSINSLVSELVGLGWVDVVEPVLDGQGGRPPQRFAFRSRAGLLVGLDIGVHRISVLLADLDGAVLVDHQVAVDPTLAPSERLEAIDRTLHEALAEHGASPQDVWAVGAAVTGPVDATGRTSLFSPLPGWTDVDLVGHLATTFSCPVSVENDVKLALLAEHAWGAAQGADDVVYILAGLRTGAAAFVNGVLVKGHAGAACTTPRQMHPMPMGCRGASRSACPCPAACVSSWVAPPHPRPDPSPTHHKGTSCEPFPPHHRVCPAAGRRSRCIG